MLRRLIAPLASLALAAAIAAPVAHAENASAVSRFGAPVTAKKPVNIARLAKAPHKFVGQTVRLEGTVAEVCQGRGCWVSVKDARGASFLAKSLDETVLLPKDCAGQRIVVQGVVTTLKPAAHDHAEGEEVGHACPAPSYVVSTQGIELLAAKR